MGRDRELRAVAGARAGATGGLLLAGPAGVGKTRLAREAAAIAGADVHWVRATRTASRIPLGAFAPLLPPEELGEGVREAIPSGFTLDSQGKVKRR